VSDCKIESVFYEFLGLSAQTQSKSLTLAAD